MRCAQGSAESGQYAQRRGTSIQQRAIVTGIFAPLTSSREGAEKVREPASRGVACHVGKMRGACVEKLRAGRPQFHAEIVDESALRKP